MAGFSLITCVVNFGEASKVMKVAKKYGIMDGTISLGKGTAHSRFLEFLKINELRREIVTLVVETDSLSTTIVGIGKDMAFDKPHHGVAFSFPLTEFIDTDQGPINTVNEVKENMYSAIYVVVDKGKADDVIEAANKAGARGGTVVNARASHIHEAQKLFSIEIEPEKEKVFIITKNELKDAIISSVREQLHIDEPGNGIIYVIGVSETYGLH